MIKWCLSLGISSVPERLLEAKSLCLAGGDSIQQHPLLIVSALKGLRRETKTLKTKDQLEQNKKKQKTFGPSKRFKTKLGRSWPRLWHCWICQQSWETLTTMSMDCVGAWRPSWQDVPQTSLFVAFALGLSHAVQSLLQLRTSRDGAGLAA